MADDLDAKALLLIQQWLHEHSYTRALATLEQEAGVRYVDEKLPRGSQLMELLYRHAEEELAAALDDVAAERQQREEELMRPGRHEAIPCVLLHTIPLLQSNVLCVQCLPSLRLAVAGQADGRVSVLSYEGHLIQAFQAGTSGVLCLALAPGPAPLLAAGCMDGSVVLADLLSCEVLHTTRRAHTKYVVAAAWAADGKHLATGSWDQTVCVFCWNGQDVNGKGNTGMVDSTGGGGGRGGAGAGSSAAASGSSSGGAAVVASAGELVLVHQEQCPGQVTSLLLLPDGTSLLVAVRDSNYLRQLSIARLPSAASSSGTSLGSGPAVGDTLQGSSSEEAPALQQRAAVVEAGRLNMNANNDDHVSFSAMHLALSPNGRYLLVSADNARLVMFELQTWRQVRNFYGLPVEQFHQYCAAFDASGRFVLAAAAHGGVCVYDVASAKVVRALRAHEKNVRGLCVDAQHNLLLTCSFDRSVKVWGAATG